MVEQTTAVLDLEDETGKSRLLEAAKVRAKAHTETCTLSKTIDVDGQTHSRLFWFFFATKYATEKTEGSTP